MLLYAFANCIKEVGSSALASFFMPIQQQRWKAAYCRIIQAILQPLVIRLALG